MDIETIEKLKFAMDSVTQNKISTLLVQIDVGKF